MPSLPNLDLQKSGDGVSYTARKNTLNHPGKYLVTLLKCSVAHPPAAVLCSVSWWSRRASPRALKMKWDLQPVDWFVSGPKRSWVVSLTTWRTWPASCSIATTLVLSPWLHSLLWPEHPQVRMSADLLVWSFHCGLCVFVKFSLCCVHHSWQHHIEVLERHFKNRIRICLLMWFCASAAPSGFKSVFLMWSCTCPPKQCKHTVVSCPWCWKCN